jgi:hypothetical protein
MVEFYQQTEQLRSTTQIHICGRSALISSLYSFSKQSVSCQCYQMTNTLSFCLCLLWPLRSSIHLHRAYKISLGNNCEQPPDSDAELSQSQPTIPASAVLASLLESVPEKMSKQFNVSGRPIAGTPMASILSFRQAHQQMHLPGVLMPLTNGRFQFKIVPLHGMTSKNTYMYPSKRNHRLWFIFYMLDKKASSVEAARKLTKGVHNIMSNGR